jgi:hypothetical protein
MPQPLRVLVCIPHFYQRGDTAQTRPGAENGSSADPIEERARVFRYCLAHLGSQLRGVRFRIGSSGERFDAEGREMGMDVVEAALPGVVGDIKIHSVADHHILGHVLDRFDIRFAEAYLLDSHPRMLGYQCRFRFARHLEEYDLFCFIEDDTAILDPRFFLKVRAFYDRFGEDKVLLPNRYELTGVGDNSYRSYLDGQVMRLHRTSISGEEPDELVADTFENQIRFERTDCALSGCYVLTEGQLRRWMQQPDFTGPVKALLDRGFDPLEMNQIPLMGSLPIYRPAMENLDFLEVHHVPNRLSNARTPRAGMEKLLSSRSRKLQDQ